MDAHASSVLSRFTLHVGNERRECVAMIRTLVELEDLGIHLELGYSSVFTFLTERFGLSNASAYRRTTTVALARRMPSVLSWLEDGRVSLKKVCLLKEVLTPQN